MARFVRLKQDSNALLPILVTLLGIVRKGSFVQCEKARLPTQVTLLGTMRIVRPEQPIKV
jgi:hypothetical protein